MAQLLQLGNEDMCHQVQPVTSSLLKQQLILNLFASVSSSEKSWYTILWSVGAITTIFHNTDDSLFLNADTGQSNIQLAM